MGGALGCPGLLWGFSRHTWAALGVRVYFRLEPQCLGRVLRVWVHSRGNPNPWGEPWESQFTLGCSYNAWGEPQVLRASPGGLGLIWGCPRHLLGALGVPVYFGVLQTPAGSPGGAPGALGCSPNAWEEFWGSGFIQGGPPMPGGRPGGLGLLWGRSRDLWATLGVPVYFRGAPDTDGQPWGSRFTLGVPQTPAGSPGGSILL